MLRTGYLIDMPKNPRGKASPRGYDTHVASRISPFTDQGIESFSFGLVETFCGRTGRFYQRDLVFLDFDVLQPHDGIFATCETCCDRWESRGMPIHVVIDHRRVTRSGGGSPRT